VLREGAGVPPRGRALLAAPRGTVLAPRAPLGWQTQQRGYAGVVQHVVADARYTFEGHVGTATDATQHNSLCFLIYLSVRLVLGRCSVRAPPVNNPFCSWSGQRPAEHAALAQFTRDHAFVPVAGVVRVWSTYGRRS